MSELLFKYHLRISPRGRSIRFHVTPERGLALAGDRAMPANNRSLWWRK